MKFWQKFTQYLKELGWFSKVLSWTKVPQLQVFDKIVAILNMLTEMVKKYIININQKQSDQVTQATTEADIKIEEERNKPLPEQDNDVLREQARKRHGNH